MMFLREGARGTRPCTYKNSLRLPAPIPYIFYVGAHPCVRPLRADTQVRPYRGMGEEL